MPLAIGEVARRAGCSVPTIRYYESIGLIGAAPRTVAGRRSYGWPDIARLSFIRRARDFGLSIDQVRQLVTMQRGGSSECEPAQSIIADRLEEVRAKRSELAKLETELAAMLARCGPACCEPAGPCSILTDIEA